ncbi:hypothetical protein AALO_G00163180 [Alosa alosa]|uniref:Uncharacterized protein n=1 Tax=Alosa alosa TaxID=278164 RepID=A0AAV6GFT4_9TELE|nr:hypothetical protein AALO_G00163180 [Alosa alosa]
MVHKSIVVGLVVLLVVAVGTFVGVFYGVGKKMTDQKAYFKAAVAADAGPCSEIGRDILKKGGSAVDSAIAGLLCVGLMSAQHGHRRRPLPHHLRCQHRKSGDYQRPGVRPSECISGHVWEQHRPVAHRWAGHRSARRDPRLRAGTQAAWQATVEGAVPAQHSREVFCDSKGNILRENSTIYYRKLADTYEAIANQGPDAFYKGPIAENMVRDIQAAGGIVTLQDLQDYQARLEEALCVGMGEYRLCVPPAPASGPVLALILNILKGYKLGPDSVSTLEKKVLTYHRIVEAFRFAYAKRSVLGDPHFVNVTSFVKNITSDDVAELFRSRITDDTTHPMEYYEPEYFVPDDHGTAHLSVMAEDGSAVAATSTINTYFGSKVMSNSTGILLNNEMDDFSSPFITNAFGVPPSPNNFILPGKRPLSSMVPTIFLDKNNKVKMVVGGSGGTKITTATASVILHALVFDYDLKTAIAEPRIHNQLAPNTTYGEMDFDPNILEGLEQKNHDTALLTSVAAVVQAVMRQGDGIFAESDPRKGGYAAGY